MNLPRHRATVLTPSGAGAIAVIKLTGPDPARILEGLFVHARGSRPQKNGKLLFGRLMDGMDVLDDVLVSVESASDKESSVEISCHGGTQIVHRILDLLEWAGAAIEAESLCALSHWPSANLVEQEAIAALAQARTPRAARYASQLRRSLLDALVILVDLWDENPGEALAELQIMLSWTASARALLSGLKVSLAGPPNSGKSTLFNTLIGREAVVTSPIAGTTRDWVMESLEFAGVPIDLFDTAGRHDTLNHLEAEAIEGGHSKAQSSDAVFLVLDATVEPSAHVFKSLESVHGTVWVVANKCDLGFAWSDSAREKIQNLSGRPPICVSARLSTGCEMLKESLVQVWGLSGFSAPIPTFFTERQVHLANEVLSCGTSTPGNPIAILLRNLAGRAGEAL